MRYRRTWQAGGTYFFTVNLADRTSHLLVTEVNTLRESVRKVKTRHPFAILAWVVMPDHLHVMWTLPEGDGDNATRWSLIKSGFSRNMSPGEQVTASRLRKGKRGIWQRRFWEHLITDETDLSRHFDYIHIDPVKHGHAQRASDWPYSSIHRYIRAGWITEDWAAGPQDATIETGERTESEKPE
jgi:putative transposase